MAKQKKQLWILLGVMVACLLVYLGIRFYTKRAEEKEAEKDAQEIVVVQLESDSIEAFSYVVDDTQYSFTKSGGVWSCDQEPERSLDADVIDTMLGKLAYVTAEEELESYESLSDYGFDAPQNTLSFTCGGSVTTIYIGSYNAMLSEYYLKLEGSDTVYLVDSTLKNAFSKTLEDLTQEEEETEEETETETEEETETETGSETEAVSDTGIEE